MKHRDKVDLFLTLLAGLPLLASGLFGLCYITSLMLSDYQHALWIAQAMSALLIWIGGYLTTGVVSVARLRWGMMI